MDVLKRNNVTVMGAGPRTLVLVHGFGCDQRMWRLVAPELEQHYRVVLLDLVGAGRSDWSAYDPERYQFLQTHAEDVLAVLRALNLSQVVLVGHSVGAMIALLAAVTEPARFAHLVLVTPSPRYINAPGYPGAFEAADIEELLDTMDENYQAWAGSIAPVLMDHPDRPELAAELAASFCYPDPTIARHFARVTFLTDCRAELPRVTTPTLILQCTADAIVPLAVGEYVHEQIAGSELVVLDTPGHCPQLSAPAAVVEAIYHYLGPVLTPAL